MTYELIIKFVDGTSKIINGVSGYEILKESSMVKVTKNGYNQFFNKDFVMYVGRTFDIGNS